MTFKEKLAGILLIFMGILPWLLKIPPINDSIGKYAVSPGDYLYQAILIIIGLFLLVKFRKNKHQNIPQTR